MARLLTAGEFKPPLALFTAPPPPVGWEITGPCFGWPRMERSRRWYSLAAPTAPPRNKRWCRVTTDIYTEPPSTAVLAVAVPFSASPCLRRLPHNRPPILRYLLARP